MATKAWFLSISMLLLLGLSVPCLAEDQSHDSIYHAVEQHIQNRLEAVKAPASIEITELDRRLTLTQCDIPLESYDPPSFRKLGRTSVGIRCNGVKPWSLFVSAQVSVELPVLVARRPLSRGRIIAPGDLELRPINSDELYRDYLTGIEEASGKRLRRNLKTGDILNSGMLLTPKAVEFGSRVTLISRVSGLEVRMTGKAMGQGVVGDRVAVKNLSSQKTVEGVIRSMDVVEVF